MAAPRTLRDIGVDFAGHGTGLSSFGSELFVLHQAPATVHGTPLNPWKTIDGSASGAGNAVRVPITGGTYLDMYLAWWYTSGAPTLSTSPELIVYGRTRGDGKGADDRLVLSDLDPTNLDAITEFWKVLRDPNPPSGFQDSPIDWPTGASEVLAQQTINSGAATLAITRLRSVFLAGAHEIVPVIQTAAVFSASVTGSAILGQIVG